MGQRTLAAVSVKLLFFESDFFHSTAPRGPAQNEVKRVNVVLDRSIVVIRVVRLVEDEDEG